MLISLGVLGPIPYRYGETAMHLKNTQEEKDGSIIVPQAPTSKGFKKPDPGGAS